MTLTSRRAGWVTGCAVTVSAFLLTSCTTSGGGDDTGHSSRTPAPSSTRVTTDPAQKRLAKQADAALASVQGGTLVESGVESVANGVHTEPGLSKGTTYRLKLVCAGSGKAQLAFTPAGAGTKATVPCDESVVQQRVSGGKLVRIDVDGAKGTTGVIAWQIDAL